jgi:hypothetical protein
MPVERRRQDRTCKKSLPGTQKSKQGPGLGMKVAQMKKRKDAFEMEAQFMWWSLVWQEVREVNRGQLFSF